MYGDNKRLYQQTVIFSINNNTLHTHNKHTISDILLEQGQRAFILLATNHWDNILYPITSEQLINTHKSLSI